jgi:hypothetical protein
MAVEVLSRKSAEKENSMNNTNSRRLAKVRGILATQNPEFVYRGFDNHLRELHELLNSGEEGTWSFTSGASESPPHPLGITLSRCCPNRGLTVPTACSSDA